MRSKGFRLGSGREPKMGQVVYVPVKTGSVSAREAAAGRFRRGARGQAGGAGGVWMCVRTCIPGWSAGLLPPGRLGVQPPAALRPARGSAPGSGASLPPLRCCPGCGRAERAVPGCSPQHVPSSRPLPPPAGGCSEA